MPKDTGIEASPKRREDVRFLTGKGRYTDDIDVTGQTHGRSSDRTWRRERSGRLIRPPLETMDGVVRVVTKDFKSVGGFPRGGQIHQS